MDKTARLDLPLLAVAQAAKEMTVNEALTLLDGAVQPAVDGVASVPPATPAVGQGWLVGSGATGAFAGHGNCVAMWTAGGWRFVAPFAGMAVWRLDTAAIARFGLSTWTSEAAITAPTGGSVIDAEARTAIAAITARLRGAGILEA